MTTVTNIGGAPATPSTFSAVVPAHPDLRRRARCRSTGTARTDAAVGRRRPSTSPAPTIAAGSAPVRRRRPAASSRRAGRDRRATARPCSRRRRPATSSSHSPVAAYADLFAPTWPLCRHRDARSPSRPSADLAMSRSRCSPADHHRQRHRATWTFRVTNNGPLAATGVSAAVSAHRDRPTRPHGATTHRRRRNDPVHRQPARPHLHDRRAAIRRRPHDHGHGHPPGRAGRTLPDDGHGAPARPSTT